MTETLNTEIMLQLKIRFRDIETERVLRDRSRFHCQLVFRPLRQAMRKSARQTYLLNYMTDYSRHAKGC